MAAGGSLTLNTSQVLRQAQGPGGGVANTGDAVVLNNSDVDHNTAASGGAGGLLNQERFGHAQSSEVNSNTSTTGGGIASGNGNGGVKPPILSTLLIVNSDVINNSATSAFGGPAGGGIANGGIATIIGSRSTTTRRWRSRWRHRQPRHGHASALKRKRQFGDQRHSR